MRFLNEFCRHDRSQFSPFPLWWIGLVMLFVVAYVMVGILW